jgi:hypothetical protein
VQVNRHGQICASCRAEGRKTPKAVAMPPPSAGAEADPYEVCQRQLRLISRTQDLIEAMQADPDQIATEVAKQVNALTRSMGSVVKEARAYEQLRAEQANELSAAETVDSVATWVAALPPEQGRAFDEALKRERGKAAR